MARIAFPRTDPLFDFFVVFFSLFCIDTFLFVDFSTALFSQSNYFILSQIATFVRIFCEKEQSSCLPQLDDSRTRSALRDISKRKTQHRPMLL